MFVYHFTDLLAFPTEAMMTTRATNYRTIPRPPCGQSLENPSGPRCVDAKMISAVTVVAECRSFLCNPARLGSVASARSFPASL